MKIPSLTDPCGDFSWESICHKFDMANMLKNIPLNQAAAKLVLGRKVALGRDGYLRFLYDSLLLEPRRATVQM